MCSGDPRFWVHLYSKLQKQLWKCKSLTASNLSSSQDPSKCLFPWHYFDNIFNWRDLKKCWLLNGQLSNIKFARGQNDGEKWTREYFVKSLKKLMSWCKTNVVNGQKCQWRTIERLTPRRDNWWHGDIMDRGQWSGASCVEIRNGDKTVTLCNPGLQTLELFYTPWHLETIEHCNVVC